MHSQQSPHNADMHSCLFLKKKDCPSFLSVSVEEFLDLAENLRPWTERAMKIEVAPWIKDYLVEMEELYCELILEEVAYKLSKMKMKRTIVENYQVLFARHTKVPNKILAKGDPGMGKTTWSKKIAYDWAKKKFNNVSIVLLVYLKLVNPDDSLENAMIEQIPELEGLRVSPSKLESFIEHFGERCLLILDGLDEHAFGSNKDVLKVLQHRKYLNCNILVTSRPHITAQIRGCCQTVVSVEGFTRSEARKFAFTIVSDEKAVDQILDFNPTGGEQEVLLHKCPILLSFMCILVRENAVDLTNKSMPTGEIYTKMIQCLYKKFTIRRGISYDDVEFTKIVGLVGKLAWETLLSGNVLFERSRVEREVGEDVFDYGFLIGSEDMIHDMKADILITFAHRSVHEFFGAFGFVRLLNNREDSSLDLNSREPILLMNPLFLHFCFWFLSKRCNRDYLPSFCGKTAIRNLHTYIHNRIQNRVLDFRYIVSRFPAINVPGSAHTNDGINMKHFEKILKMSDDVQCVTLRYDDPIDWILNHIKSTLALIVVKDDSKESQYNVFPEFLQSKGKDLNIVLSGKACTQRVIKCVLERAALWERHPIVYMFPIRQAVDISEILHQEMRKLYVIGTQTKVIASSDRVPCPFLTHISITGDVALYGNVMLAICKVGREGELSNLKSLNFGCSGPTGPIGHLFDAETTLLTVTSLGFCDVGGDDIESLSQNWINVTSLSLNTLTESGFRRIMRSLGRDILTNLKKLCLSVIDTETIGLEALEVVKPQNLPQLEHLGLQRRISSKYVLKQLSHLAANWRLHTLDISHSRGINGKLSILLQYEFPSLKSLNLHDCELNAKDREKLDQANEQGRLPVVEDLDLSENCRLIGDLDLMTSKWIRLKRLNFDHPRSDHHVCQLGFEILGKLIMKDCIPTIQELRLAIHYPDFVKNKTAIPKKMRCLERLDIVTYAGDHIKDVLDHIRVLKNKGYFPSLKTVCVLTDKVNIDVENGKVSSFYLDFREIGVELNLINSDFEKLAIGSGLIKCKVY